MSKNEHSGSGLGPTSSTSDTIQEGGTGGDQGVSFAEEDPYGDLNGTEDKEEPKINEEKLPARIRP